LRNIGAPLAIAALLGCITPAGASLASNRLASNGTSLNRLAAHAIANNGIPANARITTGSALGDLNGVAVEAVVIPEARAAESRSVLDERALVCGRHIFGWYFPFRVAQLPEAARRQTKIKCADRGT
jgi:hypothetical protein